ncbi:class I SAM-dependent methyltransferase [Staphylococcus aureus]
MYFIKKCGRDYLVALKEMNRVLKNEVALVCLETSQPTLPVL